MILKFIVNGKPQGKARPRFDSRTKRTYTPETTKAYEELVRLCFLQTHKGIKLNGEIGAEKKHGAEHTNLQDLSTSGIQKAV